MIKFFSICTILKLNITDPKKDLHKEKYKNKNTLAMGKTERTQRK